MPLYRNTKDEYVKEGVIVTENSFLTAGSLHTF